MKAIKINLEIERLEQRINGELYGLPYDKIDKLIYPVKACNYYQWTRGKRKWNHEKILEVGERLGL